MTTPADLPATEPELRPPAAQAGVFGWLRKNLFSTWYNSLLTLALAYALVRLLVPFLDWAVFDAHFLGSSEADCSRTAACWVFVGQRLDFFIYGFYPETETWRANIVFAMIALCFVPQMVPRLPGRRPLLILGFTVLPVAGFILIHGGLFGLASVATNKWGGLMLTLVLAYAGMVASLPIGILLALGRRSHMPAIRGLSVAFIELWRGVPLITVLFMASVMIPLFLPHGVSFDKLLRVFIGISCFWGAYMAEIVRGGLQAIPSGQYEAADALGLGYWKKMMLIILPQALKTVIPGIVNTLIALFKDTTLVLIIGLFDILGTIQATITDPAWGDVTTEAYLFVAALFFIFTFGLSLYSRNLERKLRAGAGDD
ncbi:amino acid ABC transporter permease [Castellaniella caeni]|uniref:amino acid ABC transporter permease n=1 Tax=Castellaniella caeni TaxID=266123 RepID=UPI00082A3758|nr:amino acid ABC transporter permease [Castellaniella caeni]